MTIELNRENLKLVLDHIKADPHSWEQDDWHSECGTKHCFAGWAQILSGKPASNDTVIQDARIFLGLARAQAKYLFSCKRVLADFEAVLTEGFRHDRDGFDDNSLYDGDGFNRDGFNRDGFDHNSLYDGDGFDCFGRDRDGRDRCGRDRDGFDRAGYDLDGLDKNNNPRRSASLNGDENF
jgi:hypothetical protein